MDPWLKAELRLAERQGLLQTRHISPVQERALVVLNFVDEYAREYSRRDHVMNAMIASGQWDPAGFYPEYFPDGGASSNDKQFEEGDDPGFDYSAVEWHTPAEGEDAQAEFERLMGMLANNQGSGTMTGDQMVSYDEWR